MVDVAFVCLGNICRSTMAEAIIRQRLKERGISDVIVHSRGTGRWNLGEPPHQGTQKILKQHHIPFDGINPNLKGQLFKLLEFSNMEETDVPDPYYTNNFEGVYDMVQSSCDNLIDFIVKDTNLKEG